MKDSFSDSIIIENIKRSVDASLVRSGEVGSLAFNVKGSFPFRDFGGEFDGWTVSFFEDPSSEGFLKVRFGLTGDTDSGKSGAEILLFQDVDVSIGVRPYVQVVDGSKKEFMDDEGFLRRICNILKR